MIAGLISRYIAPYALAGLAALLALSLAALGVQSYRLKSLQASTAEDARKASEAARAKYEAQTQHLNTVAANLVHTQQERDHALKKTGRKVSNYIRRPGPPVQCFDDDGLHIIGELARGKATSPGAPARPVPERTAGTD